MGSALPNPTDGMRSSEKGPAMQRSEPTAADESSAPAASLPPPEGAEQSLESAHLKALSRVSAALCGLFDLQAILRVGLDSVLDLLEGAVGGILLVDEDSQTLHYRITHGLSREAMEETAIAVGEGIAGKVVDSGRAIFLEDLSLDPEAVKQALETGEVPSEGLGALASIPLRSGHRICGAINAVSRTPRRFDTDDLHVLHSIGEQMGVAIERAETLEQLKRSRETYQRLARHSLVAQDEERRRIARELHDETSQSISAMSLNLRVLVELAEASGQSPELVDRMKKIEALAQQTAFELTRIINDLRPALLDSAGFVPAIRRFAQEHLQLQGVDVSVEVSGVFPRLAPEVEASLFRFIQGAVSNIARHAEARTVSIAMDCREDSLMLRLRDDGRGFDISQITDIDEKTGRGRGLFAMKERIRLLDGSCKVESVPGEGTTVSAEIPLKEIGHVHDTNPYSR
jgi:signal transduction histidine kinase